MKWGGHISDLMYWQGESPRVWGAGSVTVMTLTVVIPPTTRPSNVRSQSLSVSGMDVSLLIYFWGNVCFKDWCWTRRWPWTASLKKKESISGAGSWRETMMLSATVTQISAMLLQPVFPLSFSSSLSPSPGWVFTDLQSGENNLKTDLYVVFIFRTFTNTFFYDLKP